MLKYGMLLRPVGLGCQPNDFIKFEDADKWRDGYWSFVYYDRELSSEELKKYEMEFIEEVK